MCSIAARIGCKTTLRSNPTQAKTANFPAGWRNPKHQEGAEKGTTAPAARFLPVTRDKAGRAKKPIAERSAQALSRPTVTFATLSGEATILTIAVSLTCILSGALRLARWRPVIGPQVMSSFEGQLPFHSDAETFVKAEMLLPTVDSAWRRQWRIQSEYVRKHFCQHALRDFLLAGTAGLQREHARSATLAAQPIE